MAVSICQTGPCFILEEDLNPPGNAMLIKKPEDIEPSETTPEGLFLNRRKFLAVAGVITAGMHDQLGANPIREAEIQTGLWTLRFLAVTLALSPIRRILGWNFLSKYRRMLGLFTFFYACVHLSMWAGVDWFFAWGDMWHEIVKHKYILIGMFTWLTLLPLAITSTKRWVRQLGKRWTPLHRLVYVAAVTGTIHYLWAVKKDTFFPLVYLAIFAVLLGYRFVSARRGITPA